jgi:hypothetical protein
MEQLDIIGWIETEVGRVPRVATDVSKRDRWGTLKARWGLNRMDYTVDPGLYAVGRPDPASHIFVTANYKLTFDIVRDALKGLDAWMMVLDTKGINVWCAAGKGTFGTAEVVNRIDRTRLAEIVKNRRLILPQLGATGVAAHEVRRRSGFSVIFGPVRASDIKPFLEAGMVATPRMRRVTFSFLDRLLLVPVEITQGLRYLAAAIALLVGLAGLTREGYSQGMLSKVGLPSMFNLITAYAAGTVLMPLLLPWLPGRAFAFKGFALGLAMFALALGAGWVGTTSLELLAWALMMPAIVSYLAMNFTGASNFTSLSGVRKEMRFAVPLQIIGAVAGLSLWLVTRFS